jgi:hypothetical protein
LLAVVLLVLALLVVLVMALVILLWYRKRSARHVEMIRLDLAPGNLPMANQTNRSTQNLLKNAKFTEYGHSQKDQGMPS